MVTILFADLAGFTTLAERRDPEEVQDLLNRCFESWSPASRDTGAPSTSSWGMPSWLCSALPSPTSAIPEGAIRAALDMRGSLAEFSREEGLELAIHIGINTGRVMAGSVGAGAARTTR